MFFVVKVAPCHHIEENTRGAVQNLPLGPYRRVVSFGADRVDGKPQIDSNWRGLSFLRGGFCTCAQLHKGAFSSATSSSGRDVREGHIYLVFAVIQLIPHQHYDNKSVAGGQVRSLGVRVTEDTSTSLDVSAISNARGVVF